MAFLISERHDSFGQKVFVVLVGISIFRGLIRFSSFLSVSETRALLILRGLIES